MIRRVAGVLALVSLTACGGEGPEVPPESGSESESETSGTASRPGDNEPAPTLQVTEIANGLDTVWALAFAPDGSLHTTERGGTLRTWTPTPAGDAFHSNRPTRVDGVAEQGEAGLMGLAIDDRGRRFVMYTAERENRIVRLASDGSQTVLVDGIAAGSVHDGGRLMFGPDGKLYASTGDAGARENAERDGLNGRILRIDPETGAHDVFSTGHRNPQGLCFSESGKLFSTEHGPDRGDEVNILEEGNDYGWPETTGTGIANYTPTIAPAGCVVYEHDLIPPWKGDLLFATLKDQSLRRLDLDPNQSAALGQERLFGEQFGRLRDVVAGPDGAVYLATSNRDGRGDPREGDDRILRVAPGRPPPDL